MLSVTVQRALRNFCYYTFHRRANVTFALFQAMYELDNQPFPWIYPWYSQEPVFLATHFLSTPCAKYNGLELAAFSAKHVACYWLPGAHTQAQGEVACGRYPISLQLLDEARVTRFILDKPATGYIALHDLAELKTADDENYTFLPCNLLKYKLFQEELVALISHWLADLEQQCRTGLVRQQNLSLLQTVLQSCQATTGSIATQALTIQSLLKSGQPWIHNHC